MLLRIDNIRKKIEKGLFEFSKHAVDQSIIRCISVQNVHEVISNGTIIEDYPEDKYGPSCLIFGMTAGERPIHIPKLSNFQVCRRYKEDVVSL